MAIKIMPTILEEVELRNHLQETLEDLPNNLPQYDEMRLLGEQPEGTANNLHLTPIDDLCFLLRSPLFLYAVTSRLTPPKPSDPLPPTPKSMTSESNKPTTIFDLAHLEIRIKWVNNSWAAQLSYGDNVLLEGRQLSVDQESGFVQSFFWFCEEASFLAYEYKAREGAWTARKGGEGRTKDGKRALKLRIRMRDGERGSAGVWRIY
ncbi:hypothetical protein HBI56_090080 [Parastagonospora nodorum]|nr:hypothetical protein HBH51_093140 [Parastagonospora nodorum]KAH3979242.1 hypothetical protein HBH52_101110 [Parastagonospora nodorum]KAH3999785.1 hypothetical protein HBI10_112380 [Parastagonospora nodorum]KAH4014641.1 hypothetical protein HBI13_168710 [Parastagonospora nodorum]KAH4035064.1 hypothetical protein HBI09_094800 [Parastagonospora nodorum]